MGHRDDEGNWVDETLTRLKPGEPFWVLRAQDKLAAEVIRFWCTRAYLAGVSDSKLTEARHDADAFDAWPGKKKVPD